ncbi:MAG: N-6 DNA methylase [Planctomycetes bacterium]|nr:N-6 DNA methylase [Planctomycetota bacterium]
MTYVKNDAPAQRYANVTDEKTCGVTYTPSILADFVAGKIMETFNGFPKDRQLRVIDPAIGDGELLVSILRKLTTGIGQNIKVCGFETDENAMGVAGSRIGTEFPGIEIDFRLGSFLDFVSDTLDTNGQLSIFGATSVDKYHIVIANPPYVRTQVLGGKRAKLLSKQFGLAGRVDLYYAFILAISRVLDPNGVGGIIVSNRFMTTLSGSPIRKAISERFTVKHIWDFGDTKLFDAAVLPSVLLVNGKRGNNTEAPLFTSIYQTSLSADIEAPDVISAVDCEGIVALSDGRRFEVRQGKLESHGASDGIWRISTKKIDHWFKTVEANSWGIFRDIGDVRVGVKTCADKVFISDCWEDMSENYKPELLRTLTTHHIARRFRPLTLDKPRQIVYPHEVVAGSRRPVNLTLYPRTKNYLAERRDILENRKYVIEAGREWYEIWVPQDPNLWELPKLVFRDISEHPMFWIDLEGSIVNGDCYFLVPRNPAKIDFLWLAAAVGNSTFIERYYDHSFNNKLYAGRRRFITQYVEKFPLPDPYSPAGKDIVAKAKLIYDLTPSMESDRLQLELDAMVSEAFGLQVEKV